MSFSTPATKGPTTITPGPPTARKYQTYIPPTDETTQWPNFKTNRRNDGNQNKENGGDDKDGE